MNEPRQRTVTFLVTVTGVEPPPDWEDTQERILKREVAFMFANATVERVVDDDPVCSMCGHG